MGKVIDGAIRLVTVLRPELPAELARLDEERFGPAYAAELRAMRSGAVFSLTNGLMTVNLLIALVCVVTFFDQGRSLFVVLWGLSIAALALYGLAKQHAFSPGHRPSGSPRAILLVRRQAMVLSSLWALLPIGLYPVVSGYDGYVLTGIMAGLMAGGPFALATIPRAAFTWLGVVTVAQIIGIGLVGDPSLIGLALGTLIWAALIAHMILRLALSETERFGETVAVRERGETLARQRDELAEHRDVIDLLLRDYENQSREWRWRTDRDGNLTVAPTPLLDILGLSKSDIENVDCFRLVTAMSLPSASHAVTQLHERLTVKKPFHDVAIAVMDRRKGHDGTVRWISLAAKPQFTQTGQFDGYRGISTDVTAQYEAEERIRFLATHDPLTGLPNRTALTDAVGVMIDSGTPFAYAQVDLDRFKHCNDTLGHPAGDELLIRVASILERAAEGTGSRGTLVARTGGDEFFLAVPGPSEAAACEAATRFAQMVVSEVGEPHHLQAGVASIGASIGIATYPTDGATLDDLYARVDLALYQAKDEGRGCFRVYDAEMDRAQQHRSTLEADLRLALDRGELGIAYQPIVAMESSETTAMEALIRWRHPELGDIRPDTFVPIAEESGLIVPLGEWVLRQACREAVSWPDARRVTVNVSMHQLHQSGFPTTVLNALAESGLEPARLELELTESTILSDFETARNTLRSLRDIGVSLALDDFGTGYASLTYLREFEFDRIKIDRQFVDALVSVDDRAGSIVRAIIDLARSFGVETTAEGVERHEQIELLRNLGCFDGQGYLFGRPSDAHEDNAQGATAVLPEMTDARSSFTASPARGRARDIRVRGTRSPAAA